MRRPTPGRKRIAKRIAGTPTLSGMLTTKAATKETLMAAIDTGAAIIPVKPTARMKVIAAINPTLNLALLKRHDAKIENPIDAAAKPLCQPERSGLRRNAASAGPTWPETVQMRKIVAIG